MVLCNWGAYTCCGVQAIFYHKFFIPDHLLALIWNTFNGITSLYEKNTIATNMKENG